MVGPLIGIKETEVEDKMILVIPSSLDLHRRKVTTKKKRPDVSGRHIFQGCHPLIGGILIASVQPPGPARAANTERAAVADNVGAAVGDAGQFRRA